MASPRLSTRGRWEPVHWWPGGLRDGLEGEWLLEGRAWGGHGVRMDTCVYTQHKQVCAGVCRSTRTPGPGVGKGAPEPGERWARAARPLGV